MSRWLKLCLLLMGLNELLSDEAKKSAMMEQMQSQTSTAAHPDGTGPGQTRTGTTLVSSASTPTARAASKVESAGERRGRLESEQRSLKQRNTDGRSVENLVASFDAAAHVEPAPDEELMVESDAELMSDEQRRAEASRAEDATWNRMEKMFQHERNSITEALTF